MRREHHYGFDRAGTRFWDVHSTQEVAHAAWSIDALAELGAASRRRAGRGHRRRRLVVAVPQRAGRAGPGPGRLRRTRRGGSSVEGSAGARRRGERGCPGRVVGEAPEARRGR